MIELRDHQDHGPAWERLSSYIGKTAINVGANIGQAAAVLARNFEEVIAFEPCQESYDILRREMPDNVQCILSAVTDHDGEVELTESAYSITTGQLTTGSGLAWGEPVGIRVVPATTIDSYLGRHPKDVHLIQIDCEGHEMFVLKGALRTIERCQPDLHIEVHRREFEREIRQLLPEYEWEKIEYPNLRAESVLHDHFWMAGRVTASAEATT